MVPTDRALELAVPVSEVLEKVRRVIISSETFDPKRSSRRFTIGAPDGASSVLLYPLLQKLASNAPGVSLGLRQLLPRPGETSMATAWGDTFVDLERRAIDIAIIPHDDVPARFQTELLYEEDFVVALRPGHPFMSAPTLASYCEMKHLVVSHSADPFGFVDAVLAQKGLARQVALTAPNFMLALALLTDTDFLCALPRHFVQTFGTKFGIEHVDAPLDLGQFQDESGGPESCSDGHRHRVAGEHNWLNEQGRSALKFDPLDAVDGSQRIRTLSFESFNQKAIMRIQGPQASHF